MDPPAFDSGFFSTTTAFWLLLTLLGTIALAWFAHRRTNAKPPPIDPDLADEDRRRVLEIDAALGRNVLRGDEP